MSFVDNLSRNIVGSSDAMMALRKSVMDVAEHNIPVLILGPSGSGKEVVAQSLADLSGRSGSFEYGNNLNCKNFYRSSGSQIFLDHPILKCQCLNGPTVENNMMNISIPSIMITL